MSESLLTKGGYTSSSSGFQWVKYATKTYSGSHTYLNGNVNIQLVLSYATESSNANTKIVKLLTKTEAEELFSLTRFYILATFDSFRVTWNNTGGGTPNTISVYPLTNPAYPSASTSSSQSYWNDERFAPIPSGKAITVSGADTGVMYPNIMPITFPLSSVTGENTLMYRFSGTAASKEATMYVTATFSLYYIPLNPPA